jgi:flagellar protein FliS
MVLGRKSTESVQAQQIVHDNSVSTGFSDSRLSRAGTEKIPDFPERATFGRRNEMYGKEQYRRQAVLGGLTRVEMLIALYDRAIHHLELTNLAYQAGQVEQAATEQFQVQKMLFGIFAGLKMEESEVATNIGRLLSFTMDCLVKKDYPPAIKILTKLRDGFVAIREEANKLEHAGTIPTLDQGHAVEVTV